MILYHATTRQALPSIARDGLCVRYADEKARIKGVWLHTASNSAWALLHTQRKHASILDDIVVVEVRVPRSWLRRFKTGIWYTLSDIPVERLGRIIEGSTFAASAK